MKSTAKILIIVSALFSFAVGGALFAINKDPDYQPPKVFAAKTVKPQAVTANNIEDLTNQYRLQHHLPSLKSLVVLRKTAQLKADELCDLNYWAHDRPDGSAFSSITNGYFTYDRFGENLAKGFDNNSQTLIAWENSPKHNENLLGDWDSIGIASRDCNGTTITVQHFGKGIE